jgi:hypothetical protein
MRPDTAIHDAREFTSFTVQALFAGKEEVIYCKARDEAQKS